MNYGFETSLNVSIDEAEKRISSELKKEGFGRISRIDMKEKFKEKLNVDYSPYIILGFCNPPMAYEAVKAEDNIGLLLPCNVVVYEKEGRSHVAVIRPSVAMSMVENDALGKMAMEIEVKLQKALESL